MWVGECLRFHREGLRDCADHTRAVGGFVPSSLRRRLAAPVLPVAVFVLALTACGSSAEPEETGLTTSSSSSDFDNAQDRLDFVARYVSKVEPATDARFDIFYQENSQGRLPGPSDWSIKVVLLTAPGTAQQWSEGLTAVDELDIAWSAPLLEGTELSGEPQFFVGQGVERTIYASVGIVLIHSTTF